MKFSAIILFVVIEICASDPGAINRIRDNVVKWAASNAGSIHANDLARVKSQDAFIGNYLTYHNNNEAKAQKALVDSLQYFKSENFHDINDAYFASEFYAAGAMHVGGQGVRNERLYSSLQRCLLPVAANGQEIYQHFLKFCMYNYWKLVQGDASRGHIIHLLFKGAIPINVDIPLVKDTAPHLIAHIYMHPFIYLVSDASIITEPLVRLTMTILQVKNVRYIKDTDLALYEALPTVPALYAGTAPFTRMPAGAKSGRCLPHLKSVPVQQWKAFTDQNKACINEGMKESGIASMEQYLRHC